MVGVVLCERETKVDDADLREALFVVLIVVVGFRFDENVFELGY